MADFQQTSESKTCKRTFRDPIVNIATFTSVITSLMSDTTMGLTKREKKSESYKVPVIFFDVNGDKKGQVYITTESTTAYNDAMNMLVADTDLSNAIAGAGSDSTEDETKALWNVKVSCAIGHDTFTLSLNRDTMTISGYADDATKNVFETWADSIAALA